MSNKKVTKRALLTSILAICLCLVMLIGSTFAWFTDTASTGVNTIKSGTLDVMLVDKDGNDLQGKTLEFKKAAGAEKEEILWEPGCTYELPAVYVKNNGTLALKYKIEVTGIVGDTGLAKAITWTIAGGVDEANKVAESDGEYFLLPEKTTSAALTIKGTMDPNAGNEYQGLTMDGIAITVYATQYTYENDSTGPNYDAGAQYPTAADAVKSALAAGGSVTVTEDVAPDTTLAVSGTGKDATLNANGNTIANTEDIWDNQPNDWSLVSARDGATLTITGNGTFQAKENDCYAVDVQDGSTVTIENGTFIGNIHAVYVEKGTAYIKGGFFSVQQKYPDANKANGFVLNCLDANRANGTATIIVTGGTFVNFNPADCWAEGEHTNFVADGYKVTSETQSNGDVWYTVVKA